jgi:hypothetical protein
VLEQGRSKRGLSSTLSIFYRGIESFHWTVSVCAVTVHALATTKGGAQDMTYQDVIDTANRLDLNVEADSRELYQALVDEQIMDPNMEYADFLLYLSVII